LEGRTDPALADINRLTDGWTPLSVAAQQGQVDQVKKLLERGADPNLPNAQGAHPIFYALSGWSLRLWKLLRKHGADPHIARSERGERLKAYAERKIAQAGSQAGLVFNVASRQELLKEVGASLPPAGGKRAAAVDAVEIVAVVPAEGQVLKRARVAEATTSPRLGGKAREPPEVIRRRVRELKSKVHYSQAEGPQSGPASDDPYLAVNGPGSLADLGDIDLTELDEESAVLTDLALLAEESEAPCDDSDIDVPLCADEDMSLSGAAADDFAEMVAMAREAADDPYL